MKAVLCFVAAQPGRVHDTLGESLFQPLCNGQGMGECGEKRGGRGVEEEEKKGRDRERSSENRERVR